MHAYTAPARPGSSRARFFPWLAPAALARWITGRLAAECNNNNNSSYSQPMPAPALPPCTAPPRLQQDPAQRPTARELYSLLLACAPTGDDAADFSFPSSHEALLPGAPNWSAEAPSSQGSGGGKERPLGAGGQLPGGSEPMSKVGAGRRRLGSLGAGVFGARGCMPGASPWLPFPDRAFFRRIPGARSTPPYPYPRARKPTLLLLFAHHPPQQYSQLSPTSTGLLTPGSDLCSVYGSRGSADLAQMALIDVQQVSALRPAGSLPARCRCACCVACCACLALSSAERSTTSLSLALEGAVTARAA